MVNRFGCEDIRIQNTIEFAENTFSLISSVLAELRICHPRLTCHPFVSRLYCAPFPNHYSNEYGSSAIRNNTCQAWLSSDEKPQLSKLRKEKYNYDTVVAFCGISYIHHPIATNKQTFIKLSEKDFRSFESYVQYSKTFLL